MSGMIAETSRLAYQRSHSCLLVMALSTSINTVAFVTVFSGVGVRGEESGGGRKLSREDGDTMSPTPTPKTEQITKHLTLFSATVPGLFRDEWRAPFPNIILGLETATKTRLRDKRLTTNI
ncbi:hypothetical protein EDC04DRAFT_2906352 [Pisolithus marmoratus]|nr:hypothetical protein EDC04DRAFT_2906352 [Pisolithus marmoratus]